MRTINEEKLKEIIRKHSEWLLDSNKGECADLSDANLSGANLSYADLRHTNLSSADLRYAVGNSKQVKTTQTDIWTIVYSQNIMAIGCEQHLISEWEAFTDERISQMESRALEFWTKWKPILKLIGVFDQKEGVE